MSKSTYDRNDPRFVEYYQTLADIIGVFWQFHKERIRTNNMHFAVITASHPDGRVQISPYDPAIRALESFVDIGGKKLKLIQDFGNSIGRSLSLSWNQFLSELGFEHLSSPTQISIPIPESAKKYLDSGYLGPLIESADRLSETFSRVRNDKIDNLGKIVGSGIKTNEDVTPQLKAIFGEDFRASISLAISKIRIDNIFLARSEIGLGKDNEKPNFQLVDGSSQGLNTSRMREFGIGGDTVGCPAGMRVSAATRSFLEEKGASVKTTMLGELIPMTSEQFDHYIGNWYRELSPWQRRSLIDRSSRLVLEGKLQKTGFEPREGERIHFGLDRDRR